MCVQLDDIRLAEVMTSESVKLQVVKLSRQKCYIIKSRSLLYLWPPKAVNTDIKSLALGGLRADVTQSQTTWNQLAGGVPCLPTTES